MNSELLSVLYRFDKQKIYYKVTNKNHTYFLLFKFCYLNVIKFFNYFYDKTKVRVY